MAQPRKKSGKKVPPFISLCVVVVFLCIFFLASGETVSASSKTLSHVKGLISAIQSGPMSIVKNEDISLHIEAEDEGQVVFRTSEGAYRYGPSILQNEDGSYDVWFSAPGNNSTQWDWITYRHSEDGVNWSKETTVLKPSPGKDDRCSVCDPGVIYFNGYYYLGYTSTKDYARKGMNNSAFVARSANPEGPYEKWNGEGWGGDPKAILSYEGDPKGWGIGELSFVIVEEELYIYYTYFDTTGGRTLLAKADTSENWPLSIHEEGAVLNRTTEDSLDVFYADDLDLFVAVAVEDRMAQSSKLALYTSTNGLYFKKCDATKTMIEDYAHNAGIAKSKEGHQNTENSVLAGYAYGKNWGRWNVKFQHVKITNPDAYKIVNAK